MHKGACQDKPPFPSGCMTRSSVRSASSFFDDMGQGSDLATKQSVQKENVGELVVKKATGESERAKLISMQVIK